MTIQTKDVQNAKLSASSILGNSCEAASAVARLAIYNVVENQIAALTLNSADDMHKKDVEKSLNYELSKYVDNFLSQKLDEFKYSVLSSLRELEFDPRVRRIDYADNLIKDVHVDLKITKKK